MEYLILSLVISLTATLFLVYKKEWFVTDYLHQGPQKFHIKPTPRVGGIGIFVGFLTVLIFASTKNTENLKLFNSILYIVLGSLLIFGTGLFEDIKRSLGAKLRLILMSLAAVVATVPYGIFVYRLDLPFDFLLQFKIVAFLFTVFALVGISNAINIIDGFNGLASMVSIIIFAGIGYVSYKVGDYVVLIIALSMIGSLLGFFILNYPNGFIFMGDGGAYFTGFVMGVSLVILVNKHPEVSPWFALTIIIYPVFEVVYSIYRRVRIKKVSPFSPDALHFHSIIYKKLTKRLLGHDTHKLRRNYSTSPFLWVLSSAGVVPAVLCWNSTPCLMASTLIFAVIYVLFYWKILLGKLPVERLLRGRKINIRLKKLRTIF